MNAPKITVLMPVLNAEAFLAETLESVWRQRYRDFEILAVDDGSTDRTSEILAACRDPRLRVLRNATRRKLAGALNRGLDEARGEFVARMDADDRMRSDRLGRQVDYMLQHPEVGCCGGWVRTFGDGPHTILRYPCGQEQVKAFALFYTPFAHPSVMFRKEWFQRKELCYDAAYYPTEDYELWSRAIFCFPCVNLPRVVLDYRVHGKSMTGGEWSDMDLQTVSVQRRMLNQALNIEPSVEESRIHRAASMGLLPATPGSFAETEAWLMKLEAANRMHQALEPEALIDMLNYVWFRMSMATVRKMGGEAWNLFCRSRLASYGPHARLRRWTIRLAATKANWSGRRQ